MISQNRNISVDVLRGMAMLLVVLGHSMSGCVQEINNSIIYQLIWTLQMPMFMLISGYVTKYGSQVSSFSALKQQIQKKTIAYLLPWIMWTFLIRGVICGQNNFLDLKWLFWHMDAGYWFLFSIWTIVIVFLISSYFSNKTKQVFIIRTICFIGGMIVLVCIGFLVGLSFLCIKLTLYYMPFYYLGYAYTQIENKYKTKTWFSCVVSILSAICLCIWVFLITRYSISSFNESFLEIIIRVLSSISGCIAISGLVGTKSSIIHKMLAWVGYHSIEIYVIHYLFLNTIQLKEKTQLHSIESVGLVTLNFAITMLLSIVVSVLLCNNTILKRALFGKKN